MKQRPEVTAYFLIFFILSVAIFALSKTGVLSPFEPIFQTIIAPVQSTVYNGFSFVTGIGSNSKIKDLENKNDLLTKKLLDQDKLIKDNKALNDQFLTQNPPSDNLLPAQIVGAPGFVPGLSVPEDYIIDKGLADGVKVGDAVVVGDNLIGIVYKTTKYLSSVSLVTNSSASFTAKTMETNALGVVKGQGGGGLILDNVVLSDNLKVGDLIVTKGDASVLGEGVMPGLILGEIVAISKNPSDLFQRAKLNARVNFSKLYKVFVVIR